MARIDPGILISDPVISFPAYYWVT